MVTVDLNSRPWISSNAHHALRFLAPVAILLGPQNTERGTGGLQRIMELRKRAIRLLSMEGILCLDPFLLFQHMGGGTVDNELLAHLTRALIGRADFAIRLPHFEGTTVFDQEMVDIATGAGLTLFVWPAYKPGELSADIDHVSEQERHAVGRIRLWTRERFDRRTGVANECNAQSAQPVGFAGQGSVDVEAALRNRHREQAA